MPTVMKNGVPTYVSVQEYNEELAKHRKDVLGIDETTGKLKHYSVEDLGKVWINGQEFTGMAYQGLLTVNTKTYVEEPKRANDGSIPNINDYDTFVVPRCKINFKYFNIEDYRRLCDAIMSNEFTVKYYDKQLNRFVLHKMYAEPEEMSKLYNVGTDVFGVLDYDVSFIGTLNDLQEYTVTYHANGGTIYGNPQPYNNTYSYEKGDRVYLEDGRYFVATYYVNSFTPADLNIGLTNETYWLEHSLSEYSNSTSFSKGDVAYEIVRDNEGEVVGRNYYIAINDPDFSGRPFTDSTYWKKISVSTYSSTKKYSSNKQSTSDDMYGAFVIENSDSTAVYEAIYFSSSFSGVDPTNTNYWASLPLGTGIEVLWGNSIVIESPEDLFNAPDGYYAKEWTTDAGYTYYPNQSLNVFHNLDLYAKWETKPESSEV